MHQHIEPVEEEGDVFLVGWEGEDDGEVVGDAWEGFDIAGDYWERVLERDIGVV